MKISLKQGVALAMVLSSAMMSSAHALTVYTAGPGSLAKGLASGFEKNRGESGYLPGHNRQSHGAP
jgi:iron(III) transport system substrate-binding protein